MDDNIGVVATHIAAELGKFVEANQFRAEGVAIGGLRGAIAFFLGCTQDGRRTEGLEMMRQAANMEIDNLVRAIASGLLPE